MIYIIKNYYFIFILLFIVLAGFYGCEKKQDIESSVIKQPAETKTDTDIAKLLSSLNIYHFSKSIEAPAFELPSIDGEMVSLSQYRGKVVLISFWTTW